MKTLIFAGRYEQFTHYVKKHGLQKKDCIYANSLNNIRGLINVNIIKTGTWWEHPIQRNIYELNCTLDQIKMKRV